MRHTAATWRLLPLAAALLAAACGDDGTDPPTPDYRPWETVSLMDGVVDPVLGSENALLGIGAAGDALTQFSTEPTAASRVGASFGVRSGAGAPGSTRALWSASLTMPAEIVGETLVWDIDTQEYVVDETAADAPADGVRIIYYAMDPFTGRPAEPLVALGSVDLVDEDVVGEERLGIRVVEARESGPAVLLDYTVGLSGEIQESEGNATFTGAGVHTETEFDLQQAFVWSEAEDSDVLALDYQYVTGEASVQLRMDARSGFEAPVWEEVDLRVDVSDGAEDVALEVGIGQSGALDGEIRLGGVVVVHIRGSDGDPTFTDSERRALSPDEVESLRELWFLISHTLSVSNALMGPGVLLLLPG